MYIYFLIENTNRKYARCFWLFNLELKDSKCDIVHGSYTAFIKPTIYFFFSPVLIFIYFLL